uniref:Uncharacterized protein n=1 Tax=Cicer arietinum TaxID=3827 RepID=A0A1S2Z6S0_CICAR|nr:putative uncharacterized protein DDB_G0290521 [Cicer arietinum]
MSHTKAAARKNPQSRTPSPSPSPSPTRSPSPPPRPTPQHSYSKRTFSDNLSSSPESTPPTITLAPLSIILPPLFQCVTLSISPAPPHLQKTLNTCSSTSSSKRRSMQILADSDISGPSVSHNSAPIDSLPQINTSFTALSSFSTTAAPYQNTPLSTPIEDEQRPFKRIKIEKETFETYKGIPKNLCYSLDYHC